MELKYSFYVLVLSSLVDVCFAFVHCFDNYDPVKNSCYGNGATEDEDSVSKCCMSVKSKGFAIIKQGEKPATNREIPCAPCTSYNPQEVVYCFSSEWWIEGRTCHVLHPELAKDIVECCKTRNAIGYSVKLQISNATNPDNIIYYCTPCAEANIANVKTPWTPCSVSCGGGWRKQELTCSHEKSSTCFGAKALREQCNMEPCPSLSTTAKALIAVGVVAVIIIIIIGIVFYWYKRKKNNSNAIMVPMGATDVGFQTEGKEGERVNFNSNYTRDPTALPRALPKTPEFSPKPLESPPAYSETENDDSNMYEYVGLDAVYTNNERPSYLSMK